MGLGEEGALEMTAARRPPYGRARFLVAGVPPAVLRIDEGFLLGLRDGGDRGGRSMPLRALRASAIIGPMERGPPGGPSVRTRS